MSHPTKPLTPADSNLQDFPRMMLNIARLRGSAFDAMLDDTAWRAGVNLWMTAWHQVPAGSLPADEPGLMKAAGLGRDARTWKRIRELAMHGWILCDDGRYYHPTVAETVLEAWLNKLLHRLSSGHGNAKKYGLTFDPAGVTAEIGATAAMLERLDPKAEVLAKPSVKRARAGLPPDVPPGTEAVPPGAHRGQKTSQGRGKGYTPQTPQGASIEILEWNGPPEVRSVVHHHLGKHADAYLSGYCTWREIPDRALVTASATIHAKLKACEADLTEAGWSLVLDPQAVRGAA